MLWFGFWFGRRGKGGGDLLLLFIHHTYISPLYKEVIIIHNHSDIIHVNVLYSSQSVFKQMSRSTEDK